MILKNIVWKQRMILYIFISALNYIAPYILLQIFTIEADGLLLFQTKDACSLYLRKCIKLKAR